MNQNHFSLFSINQQYDIDQSFLYKQYLALQAKYHPDTISNTGWQREALEKSMQLNDAYKILKDDYLRAEYLLKLYGYKFDDESLKNMLNSDELEEILEDFETLEDVSSLTDLLDIEKSKISQQEILISKITKSFEQKNLQESLDLTIRLKYLTNLVRNIKQKIKSLECK